MSQQAKQLWATLVQAGVVEGQTPELPKLDSPWFVKLLLAFSGWLAAIFLLGFVSLGIQFLMESSTASFITGSVMIVGAFSILRMPKNEFFEHLALAVSLAGQALIVMAIFDISTNSESMIWILISLLQIMLVIIMPNFIHRVFSSFFATYALFMSLTFIGMPYLFSSIVLFLVAWIWLNEFRYPRQIKKIQAIGYGLVLALIQIKGADYFGYGILVWQADHLQIELWGQPWVDEVLAGSVALYVVWQLLLRHGQTILSRHSVIVLLGTFFIAIVSLEAPGITVGMVIILLGFAGSNRMLLSLGIMSLIFYISSYYYLLDATLLAKSQTLFIIGLVVLIVRWLVLSFNPSEKATENG